MCKAILEQGVNIGKQCDRPETENGYCGKHQKQFLLESGLKAGKKKCSTHRCITLIDPLDHKCEKCIAKKASIKKCIAILEQHEHKGVQCSNKASNGDFCGLHTERGELLRDAKARGVRICDEGRRSCKNETIGDRAHCEECLAKDRKREKAEYDARKEQENVCLTCGIELDELTHGFRKDIQKCTDCYQKSKEIERNRGRRTDRNYLEERFANIQRHYNEYLRGSNKRFIMFELTLDEFDVLVNSPCRYCNRHTEFEAIGIDRINNDLGYTKGNVVPCCEWCNMMKGSKTQREFLEQIRKINEHFKDCDDECIDQRKSYIRKKEIINMYHNGKLPQYIEWCKADNRTAAFIEKLEAIPNGKTEIEMRIILTNAIRCDLNFKSNITRQRIGKKELFSLIERKHYDTCTTMYEDIYGPTEGFKEDIQYVKTIEELNKILRKYQNKRNR